MKKLKNKLTRKICDVMSSAALWCEGKGCFRTSTQYRFPISHYYYVEVTKLVERAEFSYYVKLRDTERGDLINATLSYDLFRRDVPIQKAYKIEKLDILFSIDNVPYLRSLLNDLLHEKTRK